MGALFLHLYWIFDINLLRHRNKDLVSYSLFCVILYFDFKTVVLKNPFTDSFICSVLYVGSIKWSGTLLSYICSIFGVNTLRQSYNCLVSSSLFGCYYILFLKQTMNWKTLLLSRLVALSRLMVITDRTRYSCIFVEFLG